jgi:Flp pilus assembly protein TadD
MGALSAHWDFDWKEAERRFRKAIEAQPSDYGARSWFGMVLTMLGRFAEAGEELRYAMRVNPLGSGTYARATRRAAKGSPYE